MTGPGVIYGSLDRGTQRGPGQRALWVYTGAVADNEFVYTYLSGIDSYWVDPVDGIGKYEAHISQVAGGGTNYNPVYFTVYDQVSPGAVGAADAIKVKAHIIGDP